MCPSKTFDKATICYLLITFCLHFTRTIMYSSCITPHQTAAWYLIWILHYRFQHISINTLQRLFVLIWHYGRSIIGKQKQYDSCLNIFKIGVKKILHISKLLPKLDCLYWHVLAKFKPCRQYCFRLNNPLFGFKLFQPKNSFRYFLEHIKKWKGTWSIHALSVIYSSWRGGKYLSFLP